MENVSGDMALFLWLALSESIIASIAVATAITVVIVIASYFNFLLSSDKGIISNDQP